MSEIKPVIRLFIVTFIIISFSSCAKKEPSVASYAECVKAGYPIQESFPPRCVTPDKRVFVEDVSVVLPNINSSASPNATKTFTEVVKTGVQLGVNHCQDGLYINGGPTGNIQIREKDQGRYSKMLSDEKYIGKKVEIIGKFPGQEMMCKALICDCDQYVLIDSIKILE
jgi:hypothetical protein